MLGKKFLRNRIGGDVELCAYVCATGAGSDSFAVRAVAQNQAQCAQQYRFAGPGLTGDDGQSGLQIDLQRLYQGKVAYDERFKHRLTRGD